MPGPAKAMSGDANGQRIVVVNPNSTEAVTAGIDEAVAAFRFAGGPTVHCLTLAEGPPGIETQQHIDGVVAPLCDLVAREEALADAFVIACFSDPGLDAARRRTVKPVIGCAESAFLTALMLGRRFGVIAILPESAERHRRYVRRLGLESHFAASLPVGLGVTALEGDGVAERLADVGRSLIADHGADVLILGCAGMARHREDLAAALGVPIIDPTQAGVAHALATVRLGYVTAPRDGA